MNIVEQRFQRGPGVWSGKNCLHTVVDMGGLAGSLTTDSAGFSDGLVALAPGMRDFGEPMRRGAFLAEVAGRLALELQRMAGAPPARRYAATVCCRQGQVRIVIAYGVEKLAVRAMALALDVVRALHRGETAGPAARIAAYLAAAQRGAAVRSRVIAGIRVRPANASETGERAALARAFLKHPGTAADIPG